MTKNITTRIFSIDPQAPDSEAIENAAQTILDGGLVAFPTETVYGLGANALNRDALNRIYEAKDRPHSDPIIAHIYDVAQLELLAIDIPDIAYQLAEKFWPGALTLVLKRAENVPENIATGMDTVAVRMPVHPVARALIKAAGVPIAAPSANTFTRPSSTSASHVLEDLNGRVEIVLDGGDSPIGLESTVIDLTNTPPKILRPGGVIIDDIRAVIPDIESKSQLVEDETQANSAPGQLIKHYSPRARVMLFDGDREHVYIAMCDTAQRMVANQKKVGILATDEDAHRFTNLGARVFALGTESDLSTVGRRLFHAMRVLDAQKIDVILVRGFGHDGIGAAIWDRLLRSAEGKVIHVSE